MECDPQQIFKHKAKCKHLNHLDPKLLVRILSRVDVTIVANLRPV